MTVFTFELLSLILPHDEDIHFFLQIVTIDSVINEVNILPTKTKPKKLVFIGSDGQRSKKKNRLSKRYV